MRILAFILFCLPAFADPFLERFCADCHDDTLAKGGLDLFALDPTLAQPADVATWVRVYDRIAAKEMPPPGKKQPKEPARMAFANALGERLSAAHHARKGTVLRRLNRREYENTLNDLFGTKLSLAAQLPEDGRSHEFDNVGAALGISSVQMQRYLDCIDQVIGATITPNGPPEVKTIRSSYAEIKDAKKFIGKQWYKRGDGAIVFFKTQSYPNGRLAALKAQSSGRYTIRIAGDAHQTDSAISFGIEGATYQRGAGKLNFGYRQLPPGKPSTVEVEVWMDMGYMVELVPYGLFDIANAIKDKGIENYRGPGLAIQHVELIGPHPDSFPQRGRDLLLSGLNRKEIEPHNPKDKAKSWYVPKYQFEETTSGEFANAITRVASAAFRRPVSAAELSPYLALFERERAAGDSPMAAYRSTIGAIFCAPDFLYLRELPGRLRPHALATRLSYFLTRSTPDAPLLAAADKGNVDLRAQTDRLLGGPRSARFIHDFTEAWLNLRDAEATTPDKQLFPEYDRFLLHSLLDESRAFFRELLAQNLPMRTLVLADFAMLNNRLAQHYQLAPIDGPEIRRVSLPADSVRGGILGQAAVHKVSANGTNTSPVVRGIWVLERLLGRRPPPPPPGVPGLEPDIRNATTLREMLEKHREMASCASCHAKIDPLGFALESFNPVGGWRDRYRVLGNGERIKLQIKGRNVRYKLGSPVDAASTLADGRAFSGFREFRRQLVANEAEIAHAITRKLLTFATGREMGFADRPEIARIVAESAAGGYRLRGILHRCVQSEIFQTK